MTTPVSPGAGDTQIYKIVIAGLGGQGVIFATRLLAQTAISCGRNVIASETHGMSQRGGSVQSQLTIGDSESPLIHPGTADLLLALSQTEALRSLSYVGRSGVVLVNAEHDFDTEVKTALDRLSIRTAHLAATRMAQEMKASPVANVIMIGLAAAVPLFPVAYADLHQTLVTTAPRGLEINLQALEAGYRAGQAKFESASVQASPVKSRG